MVVQQKFRVPKIDQTVEERSKEPGKHHRQLNTGTSLLHPFHSDMAEQDLDLQVKTL